MKCIKGVSRQEGLAMPTVIILFLVIMIFTASALSIAMNQVQMNTRYIGSVDALHYAEAGLNEYLWHLNKVDSDAITLEQNISIGDGIYRIQYIEGSVNDGYIRLRSTGFHVDYPDNIRTIEVTVSKRSFTQYVWLSNLDVSPGAIPGGNGVYANNDCVWNAGPNMHVWHGPYHTNGTLNIWGSPKFHDRVTFSTKHPNSGNQWSIRTAPSNWTGYPQPAVLNTTTFLAGMPEHVSAVTFPQNNSELKQRAILSEEGKHYYNGMTAIYLRGNSYDVRTYDRVNGVWKYNGVSYTFGSSADEKPITPSLALPANGVIYVDGLPGNQWQRQTGDLYISGEINGHLTIAAAQDIYITGYDPTDWREPPQSGGNPARLPRGAYTGGLTYTSNTDSLLGLIANRNIEILYNNWPRHVVPNGNHDNTNQRWWSNNRDVAPFNISLYGAYMAINGTVTYEGRGSYNKGVATVIGSMIQNRRSAFASGSTTGYGRSYTHDPRLLYQAPPYFLEPSESGWEINEWREVSTHVEVTEN